MNKYLKKEERKEQIKQAAIELICERGYRNTHIQDILDKIQYSKGGFYNCYQSKEELFIDILEDGMKFRFERIKQFESEQGSLDRRSFIIELLLDKLLDYAVYKKLYTILVTEMRGNEYLMNIYEKSYRASRSSFIAFCQKEGFEEYIRMSSPEFELFMSSVIISADLFHLHENKKYRAFLKELLTAYLEKYNYFE